MLCQLQRSVFAQTSSSVFLPLIFGVRHAYAMVAFVNTSLIKKKIMQTMMSEKSPNFGSLVEIPRFNREESMGIEEIFVNNQIYYEKRSAQLQADATGGYHEFIFSVPKEQFSTAIELLKEYYGLGDDFSARFAGTCPACGAKVVNVTECIDCGLTVAGDYVEALKDHPFVIFLKNTKLLEQSKRDDLSKFDSSSLRVGQKSDEKNADETHPRILILRIGHGIASLICVGLSFGVLYAITTEWQSRDWLGWFSMFILLAITLAITFAFLRKTFGRYDKNISL